MNKEIRFDIFVLHNDGKTMEKALLEPEELDRIVLNGGMLNVDPPARIIFPDWEEGSKRLIDIKDVLLAVVYPLVICANWMTNELEPKSHQQIIEEDLIRLVGLDYALVQLTIQITQNKKPLTNEEQITLNQTTYLIRKTLFSRFCDILDYGSIEQQHYAVEMLEKLREDSLQHKGETEIAPPAMVQKVRGFMTHLMSIDYQKYMTGFPNG